MRFRRSIARAFRFGSPILMLLFAASDAQPAFSAPNEGPPALPTSEQLAKQGFEPSVRGHILSVYEEARRNPQDDEPVGTLGMTLQAYGKHELAETCFRRAAGLNPESFRWLYYQANIEGWLGRLEEAVATIRKALALQPNSIPGRLRLAQLLFDSGQAEESEQIYGKLAAQSPNLATVYFGLGKLQATQEKWKHAITSYKDALGIFENYAAAHYTLAVAHRHTGDLTEARRIFARYEDVKQRPQPAEDPYLSAVESLSAGGADYFAKASRLLQQGLLQDAAAEFETALKANPRLLLAHTNLIAIYGDLGLYEQSEKHFDEAVRLTPGSVEAYANRAAALLRQNRTGDAIQALRKALEMNPFYADAHFQLGSLLDQTQHPDEAIRHYELALENNPNHRRTHYSLGRAYVQRGRFPEGIRHLRQAAQVTDRQTPGILQTLGVAYQYAGNPEEARSSLSRAKELAISFGLTSLAEEIQRNLADLPAGPGRQ